LNRERESRQSDTSATLCIADCVLSAQKYRLDTERFKALPAVSKWSDLDDRRGNNCVHDASGNLIETHEHKGRFQRVVALNTSPLIRTCRRCGFTLFKLCVRFSVAPQRAAAALCERRSRRFVYKLKLTPGF